MSKYILSVDQGTTGTTVLLIDHDGAIQGQGYQEFTQIYPKPGWVEHNAEEIWDVSHQVMQKVLADKNLSAADIAGIGITNQRETTVVWDRATGKPIHNAIVWQCRRTSSFCESMKKDGWEDRIREKTGLVVDAYFSGTKIAWILENVEGAREKAEKGELAFGTIDTWLLYKMTGGKVHATDYTNASRTLIYNIHDKKWDDEILGYLRIPSSMLPEVKNSSAVFGETAEGIIPGGSVSVAGIAGDQQSALYGQGCWEPGTGKNTYGTGCFFLVNNGSEANLSKKGLLTTLACDSMGRPVYATEGAVFITGAAIQWLRDGLKILGKAPDSQEVAESIEDTGGVYMVPAFVGLGAPYWDSEARGAIIGLTRGSGQAEIVRATLESIAYQTRDVVEIVNEESTTPLQQLNVDGGASQNDFLMQFQSDILGVKVDRPKVVETTAMGAAFLAGLAVGFWKDPAELAGARVSEKVFEPKMDEAKRGELYSGWKKAVERVRS